MFFGSKKIPELARGLGKGLREIKNATGEIQQEIKKSADVTGLKKNLDVKAQVNKIIDDAVKEPESKAETKEVEKEKESDPEHQGQPNTVSRSSASYTTNQEEK